MSSEKVTCNDAGDTLSAAPSGLVNTVQTYCGLEIAIMQTNPSPSCVQRAAPVLVTGETVAVVSVMRAGLCGDRPILASRTPWPSEGFSGGRRVTLGLRGVRTAIDARRPCDGG